MNRAMIALGGFVDDVSEWEVACAQWSCSLLRWALIVCKVKATICRRRQFWCGIEADCKKRRKPKEKGLKVRSSCFSGCVLNSVSFASAC